MIKKIPDQVDELIKQYLRLNVCSELVACPYYLNRSGFLKDPVLAGKGTPLQIEAKANELLKNYSFNGTEEQKIQQIRSEMQILGLGLDCSGLVYHAFNTWTRDVLNKGNLSIYLPQESALHVRKYLSRKLKPESSVSADMLTSEPFSRKITLDEVLPGDLIRTRGGKHILLITEVERTNSAAVKITYVNSAAFYKRNGIRYGYIDCKGKKNLEECLWSEILTLPEDEDEGFTYKGFRELMQDNGLWRFTLVDLA